MKPDKPNIVLIISDQHRYDSVGALGRDEAWTPHLDRMANEGVVFEKAFCTSPLCSPARASILSGLYPYTHGMVANNQPRPGPDLMHLPENVTLLADYLLPLGYAAGYSGKWHLVLRRALEPGRPEPVWNQKIRGLKFVSDDDDKIDPS